MKSKNATTTGLLIVVGLLLAGFIHPAPANHTVLLDLKFILKEKG